MDKFTRQYFETALWSSNDESNDQGGEPLDKNYSTSDISDETRDKMIADCADFQERFGELYSDSEQAGHDFWLSRNNHGAGFFDGDEERKDELQAAAESYGEFNLYIGDDGEIHGTPLGESGVGEARGHSVSDFNTIDDLIAHARGEGATHIFRLRDRTTIYFPSGNRLNPYWEALVWQEGGYWHTEAPPQRVGVAHPPKGAEPIKLSSHARRGAAEEEARGSRNVPAPGDENRSRLASYIAHAVMYDVATSEHDLVAAYHLTPEEARAVLSERGGWYGPGGNGYGAFVKHIKKALRKKEWFSAPDPKAIPGSAQAYGRYVWLLENAGDGDQGAKDKSDAEDLERQLSNVGFNGWGLAIDNWPEAVRYYNAASSVYRNHSRNNDEMREHSVRDYIAVDKNDRRIAGPFKSRHEADAHVPPGGHVKFATAHRRGPPSPAPSSYPMFRAAKEAGGRARRPKGRRAR